MLEKFPLPSISLLNKIQQGGVDAIKAVTFLREKGEISTDCILIVDEMYLQKATQYQGGEYIGVDKEGNLFKGIVVFMIVGLKESISYVIQALPEIRFNGKWLSEKMSKSIDLLGEAGFNVRGIVTDNHAANVNAFNCLHIEYGTPESPLFIKHPSNHNKNIYLFFDSVHILKNIRNNLLNAKKFVFPEFDYENENMSIHFPAGYITWSDLHTIYDKDEKLASNLKKAHKLTYTALHPGNNKQNVPLALAIFDESTIAATKSYLPERHDIAGFLTLIQKWWTVANSKQRFSPNVLGNAIIRGDGKTNFFMSLADWVENWKQSPAFRLTPQTASALIVTLRAQTLLIDELLEEGYLFVLTGSLQSDLNLLSRGGLTVPSSFLADFTCYCFAVLDYTDRFIQTHSPVNVRKAANYILSLFSPNIRYACDTHSDWGFRFSSKIIINIFYNNKQKVAAVTVRKDAVVDFKKRQRKK